MFFFLITRMEFAIIYTRLFSLSSTDVGEIEICTFWWKWPQSIYKVDLIFSWFDFFRQGKMTLMIQWTVWMLAFVSFFFSEANIIRKRWLWYLGEVPERACDSSPLQEPYGLHKMASSGSSWFSKLGSFTASRAGSSIIIITTLWLMKIFYTVCKGRPRLIG